MYSAVSSGLLLRNVHASISDKTVRSTLVYALVDCLTWPHTFQTIDCPLLEFLKSDLGRRWQYVEVKTVLVALLLELRCGELFLFVTEVGTSLGFDSRIIVADHRCVRVFVYVGSCMPCD